MYAHILRHMERKSVWHPLSFYSRIAAVILERDPAGHVQLYNVSRSVKMITLMHVAGV
jgi:hypothetical protein